MTAIPDLIKDHLDKISVAACDVDQMMSCWEILSWELAQTSNKDESFKRLRSAMLGHHEATKRLWENLRTLLER